MGIAAVFLAGEMAGSGVLALARAMVGTGHTLLVIDIILSGLSSFKPVL